jgi:glycine cleavage system aminomethyltransferase T
LRLQNADLETEYNLYEAGLARPKVKAADFHGKEAYVQQRELDEQAAYLCTFVLQDTTDSNGVVRYPIGNWPILDPESKEVIIDSHGRRSYTTSMAFGPSLGVNVAMGYLPADKAKERRQFTYRVLWRALRGQGDGGGLRCAFGPNERAAKKLKPSNRSLPALFFA